MMFSQDEPNRAVPSMGLNIYDKTLLIMTVRVKEGEWIAATLLSVSRPYHKAPNQDETIYVQKLQQSIHIAKITVRTVQTETD